MATARPLPRGRRPKRRRHARATYGPGRGREEPRAAHVHDGQAPGRKGATSYQGPQVPGARQDAGKG